MFTASHDRLVRVVIFTGRATKYVDPIHVTNPIDNSVWWDIASLSRYYPVSTTGHDSLQDWLDNGNTHEATVVFFTRNNKEVPDPRIFAEDL
jgi:hypothetical protein